MQKPQAYNTPQDKDCRQKRSYNFLDKRPEFSGKTDMRFVPIPMGDRGVFQMDQAKPANQAFFRAKSECDRDTIVGSDDCVFNSTYAQTELFIFGFES